MREMSLKKKSDLYLDLRVIYTWILGLSPIGLRGTTEGYTWL